MMFMIWILNTQPKVSSLYEWDESDSECAGRILMEKNKHKLFQSFNAVASRSSFQASIEEGALVFIKGNLIFLQAFHVAQTLMFL